MKSAEYGSLSRDRKEELFRCANLVFFPNNRYLGFPTKNKKQEALLAQQGQADILKQKKGQADQYSRDIIQWYQTRIKPEREMFLEGETLGKFVNNVGQYYNAVKAYDRAAPYRMESLEYKCRAICKNMGIDFPEWPDEMKDEAAGLDFHNFDRRAGKMAIGVQLTVGLPRHAAAGARRKNRRKREMAGTQPGDYRCAEAGRIRSDRPSWPARGTKACRNRI